MAFSVADKDKTGYFRGEHCAVTLIFFLSPGLPFDLVCQCRPNKLWNDYTLATELTNITFFQLENTHTIISIYL